MLTEEDTSVYHYSVVVLEYMFICNSKVIVKYLLIKLTLLLVVS